MLTIGDKVLVMLDLPTSGDLEGSAVLIEHRAPCVFPGCERWLVHFDHDPPDVFADRCILVTDLDQVDA